MKKNIFFTIIALIFVKISYACDNKPLSSIQDDISVWLGSNSEFSRVYREGKCVLDKALVDVPKEQRRLIANLIAKSYDLENKKTEEVLTYNY